MELQLRLLAGNAEGIDGAQEIMEETSTTLEMSLRGAGGKTSPGPGPAAARSIISSISDLW